MMSYKWHTKHLPRPSVETFPDDLCGIAQTSGCIAGEIEVTNKLNVGITQKGGHIGHCLPIFSIQGVVQVLRPDGEADKLFVDIVVRTIHMQLDKGIRPAQLQ